MVSKVILVTHDTADRDDRASAFFRAHGFGLQWTCPAEGGALPELTDDVAALVVYGGRYDIRDKAAHPFLADEMKHIEKALAGGVPFLGLCLGGQLLAHVLGEDVGPHPLGHAEYGYYDLNPTAAGREVFGGGLKVLQSHWHGWFETPRGATALAATEHFPQQAFSYGPNAYGFQFHPEASRTMLSAWIGRRPAARNAMPGAFPPERQLTDNLVYDEALGAWFNGFLARWMGVQEKRQAAE